MPIHDQQIAAFKERYPLLKPRVGFRCVPEKTMLVSYGPSPSSMWRTYRRSQKICKVDPSSTKAPKAKHPKTRPRIPSPFGVLNLSSNLTRFLMESVNASFQLIRTSPTPTSQQWHDLWNSPTLSYDSSGRLPMTNTPHTLTLYL